MGSISSVPHAGLILEERREACRGMDAWHSPRAHLVLGWVKHGRSVKVRAILILSHD